MSVIIPGGTVLAMKQPYRYIVDGKVIERAVFKNGRFRCLLCGKWHKATLNNQRRCPSR